MIKIFQDCPTCKGTGTIWFRDENGELDKTRIVSLSVLKASSALISAAGSEGRPPYKLKLEYARMSTTLVKQNTQLQSWTNEQVDLVKNTVAKNATDTELQMFMHIAKQYQLDPFAKEIWFIKYKQGDAPSIFTSRDGYLKIAHQSGVFDGMESFTIDNEQGEPIKAVCKVYRKDMSRPFVAEIKVKEYRQNSPTWSKYPSAMAVKVAEVFALKRAFSISGLVTKEEMPATEPEIIEINPPEALIDTPQVQRFIITAKENLWSEEAQKELLAKYGYTSRKLIKIKDYQELLNIVSQPEFKGAKNEA